jgi:hypothetical protein
MRIAILAALSLPPLTLAAQQRGARPPAAQPAAEGAPTLSTIRTGKDGFVLPEGTIDLADLIDSAARYLQRNIFYAPQELAQAPSGTTIVLQRELALDAIGCEEVLGELLYMRGFALLTVNADKNLYEVVFLFGQRAREVTLSAQRRTVDEILKRPRLKQPVITEIQLQHINASVATNALRPFFANQAGPSQNGLGLTFGTAGSNMTLLVSGFQDQVAQLIRLVQACDVPQKDVGPGEGPGQVGVDLDQRLKRIEARLDKIEAGPAPHDGKPAGGR